MMNKGTQLFVGVIHCTVLAALVAALLFVRVIR